MSYIHSLGLLLAFVTTGVAYADGKNDASQTNTTPVAQQITSNKVTTMHPPIVIPEKGLPFVRLIKHLDISRYGSEIMKAADIDGDGQPEQILALENFGVLVSDLKGNILWRKAVPNHCGEARVGKFLAAVPGLQILINNERFSLPHDPALAGSELLDCRGNVIQTFAEDIYAKTIPWKTAVGPEAMLAAYHGAQVPDSRPFIMDGRGRVIAVFDIPQQLLRITDYKMSQ